MSSNTSRKASLFLFINILCYVLASNHAIATTTATTACNSCSGPSVPRLPPSSGGGSSGSGSGSGGSGGSGTTPGQQPATCPRDALKLGVCANLLGGVVGVVVGNPPTTPCCTLLAGLADLEVAVCLCTAIRANILGINLNIPVALSLLLNVCGRTTPRGFTCG